MEKVLVSACLLGRRVRYDGGAKSLASEILAQWQAEGRVISVCPEVDAGLPTPRAPAEIIAGDGGGVLAGSAQVVDRGGVDLTEVFRQGASLALQLCRKHAIKVAVLTEYSPSCGSTQVYDGSFSGEKRAGAGVTAALLRQHGVQVFGQQDIAEAWRVIAAL
ncbi:DUF523 domain-containing protein [Halomonas sp. MCCC 1A17488]|uniref:DUF523 domain-containing protein n=1 Tax=unclassified Halomonas TaxID=2609666 RepID=UPI0018D2143D|nr:MULTISPECIES: DUF523 domain-containing protein [unclassified Halomonas]MCE8016613.1 DUF523 domain-containing protein [Halomonas sp. MCCC 1A17488]MCG3239946.1 DUF523 domain-containing protein [Halomonas sp. MCCC 1A17488]QPP50162.1 DUF523 domain-containing protein [Halomonas sp. SS10-MC5]